MIKIYRESTSFAETFLICITHLSELCADAKAKVERLYSFSSRFLFVKDLAFLGDEFFQLLLLLDLKNFHRRFEELKIA